MAKNKKNKKTDSGSHGLFRLVLILNLAADAGIAFYSAYRSYNTAVTIGMSVLGVCFLLMIGGAALIRINMKNSSCLLAGAAFLLLNVMLGGVFAGEFFNVFEAEFLEKAEWTAAAVIAADIVITVNILVKRKIDGKL